MPVSRKRKLPYKNGSSKRRKPMVWSKRRIPSGYRSNRVRAMTIFKSPKTPWPIRTNLQLRYASEVRLTHSAVAGNFTVSKTFRANSIFDPDPVIGGVTVNGHDIYKGMYGRYRVYGVRVHLQKIATSGNANSVGRMWIRGVNSNSVASLSTLTTASDLTNLPKLSFKATTPSTGSPSQVMTLKRSYTMDYLEGKRTGAENEYTSDINGNPGIVPSIEVGHTLFDTPNAADVLMQIILTYNVRLYEPTISVSSAVAT